MIKSQRSEIVTHKLMEDGKRIGTDKVLRQS